MVCWTDGPLPPIAIVIVAERLQEYDDESNQRFHQAELKSCLFAETQEANGVCFA